MTSPLAAPVDIGSQTGGSGTTAVITTTAVVLPGYGIAVFIGNSSITATISSVVDSSGNTYVASGNSPTRGSAASGWIYVCQATGVLGLPSGGTITVTFSTSTGTRALRAVRLYGVLATSPADTAVAGASGTSISPATSNTGTLASADEIELGLIVNALGVAADTFVIGGLFTSAGAVFNTTTGNLAIQPAYKIVVANTTNNYSATITSRAWVALLATYKAGTYPYQDRIGGVGLNADYAPTTPTVYPETGGLGLNVDFVPDPVPTVYREVGGLGLMVDFVYTPADIVLPGLSIQMAGSETISGTIGATLPGLSASLSGGTTVSGTIATTLAGLVADLAGGEIFSGTIDVTLAGLVADLVGEVSVGGAIDIILPGLSAALAGTASVPGTIAMTLALLQISMAGTVSDPTPPDPGDAILLIAPDPGDAVALTDLRYVVGHARATGAPAPGAAQLTLDERYTRGRARAVSTPQPGTAEVI